MIYFGFNITNPWSKRFKNLWCHVYETPFENKFIELELIKDASIASCSFKLATRTDHGGLYMDVGLLGYNFSFNFYDSRHWNDDAGRFYIYDEAGESH
jgi:hypothetical protein